MRTLQLHGYSTALFSTFYFLEDYNLLFDAGDGVAAFLMQKSRKVQQVFVSHADRDHLTGLLQLRQLNARPGGLPKIYYPKDSSSFPYMAEFCEKFDPHKAKNEWIAIDCGAKIEVGKGLYVKAIENKHLAMKGDYVKSLSFLLYDHKRKLKEEFLGLAGPEIEQLKQEKGIEALTYTQETPIFAYSGDTPVEYDGRWDGVETLIHEATFLHKEDKSRNNGHSNLEQLLMMLREAQIGRLVVGHFSSRYHHDEILQHIRQYCKQYKIDFPVYAVLPGQYQEDVLGGKAVNG